LREIDIKFKQIGQIEKFEALNHLKKIHLSTETNYHLNKNIFDNLSLENLSLTNFTFESRLINNLAMLKRLEILECSIRDSNLIKFNRNLECLIVDDNNLIELNLKTFLYQLENLKELTMSGYEWKKFDPNILKDLKNLESCFLSRNETNVIVGEFPNLENLITLDLTFNDISHLNQMVFFNLKSIKYLQLGCNKFADLQPGIFDSLTNLEELALNSNHLKKIRRGLFYSLVNLRSLFLYENDLVELDSDVFENLIQLKTLSLENNKLTELELRIFSQLDQLEFLNLKNNLLTSFDSKILAPLKNLRRLKISKICLAYFILNLEFITLPLIKN
jgi:hypothetical protein